MRNIHHPVTQQTIPAAEYVRMSTDNQEYSLHNQKETIQKYAEDHGFCIVATYADPGKSGVALKGRAGLAQLLNDVVAGKTLFNAILVYDVSRWGRFQDPDEAAHYEFLCKSHGIPVHYCAEQFLNDGNFSNLVMKTLKRTMAAEYSRELGVKVFAGMANLAKKGFRVSGVAGLGLRRMMVSPDGRKRIMLQDGEKKGLKTYHTILVPGPQKEIAVVQKIFSLAMKRRTSARKIANYLNRMKEWPWTNGGESRRWYDEDIRNILRNEKYMGCNVFGKTTKRLGIPWKRRQVNEWIMAPAAFTPIVSPKIFRKVQSILHWRDRHVSKPDEYYLKQLKRVLSKHGRITRRLALQMGIDLHTTLMKRFGSMRRAYELAGYKPPSRVFKSAATNTRLMKLYADFFNHLREIYPESLRVVHLPGQTVRRALEFDGELRVAVHLCSQIRRQGASGPRWLLRAQPLEAGYPSLICLLDRDLTKIFSMYLVPHFDGLINRFKTLKDGHSWLDTGEKVTELANLRAMAVALTRAWQQGDDTTVVGDVVMSARTSNVRIAGRQISFTPVEAEIFKKLLCSAGQVVPLKQLFRPSKQSDFSSAYLRACICNLRRKLGFRLRQRVRTVVNEGYRYVGSSDDRPRGPSSEY